MKIKDFKVLSDFDYVVVTFKLHRFLRKPKQHTAFTRRYINLPIAIGIDSSSWADKHTGETFPVEIRRILSNLYQASKCSQKVKDEI